MVRYRGGLGEMGGNTRGTWVKIAMLKIATMTFDCDIDGGVPDRKNIGMFQLVFREDRRATATVDKIRSI